MVALDNTLYFGTKIGATDSFDTNIDVLAPPQPPSGTYSYFKISDFFDKFSSDFRSNLDSTNTWSLKIIGTSGTSGTISWDNSSFPLGDFPGTLSINGTDMLSNQSISFTGDQNLTIYYKASQKYSGIPITITTIPENLTINVDETDYISPQIFDWEEGSAHTISVLSPQSGGTGIRYIYDFWSDGGDTTHTITVPDTATTFTANFTTQYYLTVNSGRGNLHGNGWYNSDSTAVFSVTSPIVEGDSVRYVFFQWSGDYQGSDNPASILMNSQKSITANWATQYKLTTSVIPSEGGNLSLNPDLLWYDSGTNVGITAIAASGYRFSHWSGDASGTDSTVTLMMTEPKKVTAHFTAFIPITVTTIPESLIIFVDGANYISPKIFDWEEGSSHTIGVSSLQSGGIGIRHIYDFWNDGGDSTHTITVPDTATTYTGNFTTQFKITTSVLPSVGGSITLNPNLSWYDNGTSVEITAITASNYKFSHWSGDVSGIDSIISLVIDTPKKVIANFLDVTEVKNIYDNNFLKEFRLLQNFPNPFNPSTIIKYQIPKSTFVTIAIYNNNAQLIETLFSNYQSPGSYSLQWDIGSLGSGIYYYKIEAGDYIDIKKCIFLK